MKRPCRLSPRPSCPGQACARKPGLSRCHARCLTRCIALYRVDSAGEGLYSHCPLLHCLDRLGANCKTSIPSSILGVASIFRQMIRPFARASVGSQSADDCRPSSTPALPQPRVPSLLPILDSGHSTRSGQSGALRRRTGRGSPRHAQRDSLGVWSVTREAASATRPRRPAVGSHRHSGKYRRPAVGDARRLRTHPRTHWSYQS